MISWLRLIWMAHVTVTLHIIPAPVPQIAEDDPLASILGIIEPPRPSFYTCTGVYVAHNQLLTAAHCIDTPKDKIFTVNKEVGHVLWRSKQKDLCLIQVDHYHWLYARLGGTVSKLQRVYTVNSGDDHGGTYSEGLVMNLVLDKLTPQIEHTAPILPGASGSGLFNYWGSLIGINTQVAGPVSFAVETMPVRQFLENAWWVDKIEQLNR